MRHANNRRQGCPAKRWPLVPVWFNALHVQLLRLTHVQTPFLGTPLVPSGALVPVWFCTSFTCEPLRPMTMPLHEGAKLFTRLDVCVSSLRRGHANLLCIVPMLMDDPRRESNDHAFLFVCSDCMGSNANLHGLLSLWENTRHSVIRSFQYSRSESRPL